MSRQMAVPSWRPVSIVCMEDVMIVTIQKNLYGNGKLIKASDLTLGPAQCKPSSETSDTVIFQNNLQDCGTQIQTNDDFLMYITSIAYKPTPFRNVPIIRTSSANIGVQCYYPRHGNVSSEPIKPTWKPFSSTLTYNNTLSFALYLMNEDWSGPSVSTIVPLGRSLYIEASVNVENHVPMRIYVDSCLALLSPDPNSNPRYELINNYGCLVDGQQDDSSSTFISQRPEPNKLRFEIDSFRFLDYDQPTIYIYCSLKAVSLDQTPDATNKACSFSKTGNLWTPVDGAANICSCCDTGHLSFQANGNFHEVNSLKMFLTNFVSAGKQSDEVIHTQLLGPIWIINPKGDLFPKDDKALAVHADSEQEVKPWMVVAVSGLWVTVVIGAVLTWKLRSRKSNVTNVEQ
uniref:Zona pellucida sperm-binding protein 3 n=1 Tax=Pyxicephalus adspersus TaxID=30357 RepID=A0AAV2ZFJ5_PYXAD|nr:TPA: hypothetical protein GDO54_004888 [Pyxicephalus adspersus]